MINLLSLPAFTSIFIDSNIFLYFLLKDERYFESCKHLLSRIEKGEIVGFINNIVISEVIFLYIKSHILARHKIKLEQFIPFVKNKPDEIAKIDISHCIKLFSIETLRIIEVPPNILLEHFPKFHAYGILPNDVQHLVAMNYLNINEIATNDADFAKISHLHIWKPISTN